MNEQEGVIIPDVGLNMTEEMLCGKTEAHYFRSKRIKVAINTIVPVGHTSSRIPYYDIDTVAQY